MRKTVNWALAVFFLVLVVSYCEAKESPDPKTGAAGIVEVCDRDFTASVGSRHHFEFWRLSPVTFFVPCAMSS